MVRRFGVAALSFTAGCSLITDVGSLQTGKDADSLPDAQSQDGPTVDSGTDTGMMGGDAEAGPLGFCASLVTAPKLCEDFDTGLFSAKFSSVHQNGGTVAGSGTAFQSSPNALLAQVPASDAGLGSGYMQRLFIGTATTLSYAFDFRPETWTTGSKSVVVAGIVIDDGLATEHTLNLYLTDGYAAVEEIFKKNNMNMFVDHTLTAPFLLGQWTRVIMTLDLGARTAKVELGAVVALAPTMLDASWAAGTPACNLGISYVASTAMPWSMRYDNVVLDFK